MSPAVLIMGMLFITHAAFSQSQLPSAQSASRITALSPDHRFPNGQTFSYQVEWRLFDAGIANLRIESAGREQRVLGAADANGVVGLLYHVHDRFESFFDNQTGCSRSISKKTEEGFRRLETNIVFDQTRNKSVLNEKNLRSNQAKQVENDTPGCVTDVLSAVFYLSSLPLTLNAVHYFPLNDGGKTVDVKALVDNLEEVKTPAGTFKTIRVQCSAATGPLRDKGQIWIWFTDDDRHAPVQIKARLFWGTLTFRLKP